MTLRHLTLLWALGPTLAHAQAPDEELCNGRDDDNDASIDEGGVCPHPVRQRHGVAFQFVGRKLGQAEADAWCHSYGYQLASPADAEENRWLHHTAANPMGGLLDSSAWIGVRRDDHGAWRWSGGAACGRHCDRFAVPTASQPSLERAACARWEPGPSDAWIEAGCGEAHGFICEANGTTPAPTRRPPDTAALPAEVCNGRDDDGDSVIDEGTCAERVAWFEGHAYLFGDEPMSWLDARSACRARGYELATLDDGLENAWVWGQVYGRRGRPGALGAWAWIGLARRADGWTWPAPDACHPSQDGADPSCFQSFAGEFGEAEHALAQGACALLGSGDGPTWTVVPCGYSNAWVCEAGP